MSWTTPTSRSTGELITASIWNTDLVNNLIALFALTGNKDIVNGRLTLESGVAVSVTDQSAKTTVYFTPFSGNQIGLYDGAAWSVLTFSELSLSLVGFTASKPYDIFAWNNGGTVTLEALVWTSATARATALVLQDGVWVKTGATTRRYLGTIYINSSGGQTDDTVLKRNVWNFYNQMRRSLEVFDTTNSWTFSTDSTWHQANASAANQVEVTVGYPGAAIDLLVLHHFQLDTANAAFCSTGVGIDSSTVNSATLLYGQGFNAANIAMPTTARLIAPTLLGRRTYRWLEYVVNAGAIVTWFGDNGAVASQSGMSGSVWN